MTLMCRGVIAHGILKNDGRCRRGEMKRAGCIACTDYRGKGLTTEATELSQCLTKVTSRLFFNYSKNKKKIREFHDLMG